MAIDTKAKRASVQAYSMGLMRPPPDGTIGEGDRATAAWLYAGLDFGDPVEDTGSSAPQFHDTYGLRMHTHL